MVDSAPSQHLFADVLARVQAACAALGAEGGWPNTDLSRVVVEPPRDASHGDMATNAAMVLAKDANVKPRDLAGRIAAKLREDDLVEKADVAGPGFINLTLKGSVWAEALRTVLREGSAYGRSRIGSDEKVNVEYVSANPTGPMHVGHCRGAVFGDALASLLSFAGYAVTREYYINDAGAQVDVLARSAYLRYREALGEQIGDIPEGLYPGDYLKRSEEHTSELQSRPHLVCRLLLEKKKYHKNPYNFYVMCRESSVKLFPLIPWATKYNDPGWISLRSSFCSV